MFREPPKPENFRYPEGVSRIDNFIPGARFAIDETLPNLQPQLPFEPVPRFPRSDVSRESALDRFAAAVNLNRETPVLARAIPGPMPAWFNMGLHLLQYELEARGVIELPIE